MQPKKYLIHFDINGSGTINIEADSAKEVKEIFDNYSLYDISNKCYNYSYLNINLNSITLKI